MKETKKVQGFKLKKNMTVTDMLSMMQPIGFQATHLGQSINIIKNIKKNKCTLFLSMTSNIISSGLREIIAQLCKEKIIDVIITSTGAIEEDIMKSESPFILGDFNSDDIKLHQEGINRIGNILVENKHYEFLEDFTMPLFTELLEEQKKNKKLISPSEITKKVGSKLKDKNSYLYWCSRNDIPVFCPGFTDGALGLNTYFFKKKNPDFGIDVTADMNKLADLTLLADKTAGIFLGGGIAKHHTIGVNILRDGLDYAIYISTATEGDGSLSGARPREAKSWSKIKEDASSTHIEAEATLIFPLIATAMIDEYKK